MRVGRFERLDGATLKPPVRMDNGFLKVEGRIARVGIQEYRKADGSVSRELRLPEEVFHPDSLASFVQLPVTNMHPPGMLTARNAKKYTVGSVGENVRQDGDYVAAPIMITDAEAIAAAEGGRSQLSNGYTCELDDTQDPALIAKWGKYDSIMRNIRGNHVALVDVARAGPGASLRLDAFGELPIQSDSDVNEEQMTMPHKFTMDGLTIEVADANTQAIIERVVNAQRERADAAEKALADAKKSDAEKSARLDMAEGKVKELTDAAAKHDAEVADRVKALLGLGAEVAKMGVDVTKLDHSETAYKVAAVKKIRPSMVLDGKSTDYINAAFDAAKDDFAKLPSAADKARAGLTDAAMKDAPSTSADEAKRRYNERLFAAGK